MALTGDFARLHQMRDRVRAIGTGAARDALLSGLRDEAHRQVIACFAEKRDPYGRAWPPRKAPNATYALRHGELQADHPLLDKTGAAINSVRAIKTSTGIKVSLNGYMVFHWQPERPGTLLPQRAMLPTARQGMGLIWGDAFLRVASRVRKQFMGAA